MKVRVIKPFVDILTSETHSIGEQLDLSKERVEFALLHGYVEVIEEKKASKKKGE